VRASEIVEAVSQLPTVAAATPTPAGGRASRGIEPGHVFGDRYRIVSLLGSGGMGEVFRVEDATSGQALALKVLRRSTPTTPIGCAASSGRSRSSRGSTTPPSCASSTGGRARPGRSS